MLPYFHRKINIVKAQCHSNRGWYSDFKNKKRVESFSLYGRRIEYLDGEMCLTR